MKSKREILEALIGAYCGGNKARFASMIGVKPQLISNWIKRNTFDHEQVYAGCENLSGDFLLSGEGEIFRNSSQNVNKQIDNTVLLLCKMLVENYQQREDVMNKLSDALTKISYEK